MKRSRCLEHCTSRRGLILQKFDCVHQVRFERQLDRRIVSARYQRVVKPLLLKIAKVVRGDNSKVPQEKLESIHMEIRHARDVQSESVLQLLLQWKEQGIALPQRLADATAVRLQEIGGHCSSLPTANSSLVLRVSGPGRPHPWRALVCAREGFCRPACHDRNLARPEARRTHRCRAF
eukprot:3468275-Prymnesium_polylepis.2